MQGESPSGKSKDQTDAEHLEYLHECINAERTEKERIEAVLETSDDNLQTVTRQRDAIQMSNARLQQDIVVLTSNEFGIHNDNQILIQENSDITAKHQTLLDTFDASTASLSNKSLLKILANS